MFVHRVANNDLAVVVLCVCVCLCVSVCLSSDVLQPTTMDQSQPNLVCRYIPVLAPV